MARKTARGGRTHRARVIALANQKGGVAKTTSVASLGAAFAEPGKRVLLVDLDAQACLTFSLGVDPDTVETSVNEVLVGRTRSPRPSTRPEDGVDLVPSVIDLAGAEAQLLSAPGPRVRPARRTRAGPERLRHRPAGLLAQPRRADPQRAHRSRRPDRPDAVRDAQPPRGRASCSTPSPTCRRSSTPTWRCWGSCRRCTTAAATTRGKCSPTWGSATGCRSSTRRSPRPCGSPRRPRSAARSWPPSRTSKGAQAYREVAQKLLATF